MAKARKRKSTRKPTRKPARKPSRRNLRGLGSQVCFNTKKRGRVCFNAKGGKSLRGLGVPGERGKFRYDAKGGLPSSPTSGRHAPTGERGTWRQGSDGKLIVVNESGATVTTTAAAANSVNTGCLKANGKLKLGYRYVKGKGCVASAGPATLKRHANKASGYKFPCIVKSGPKKGKIKKGHVIRGNPSHCYATGSKTPIPNLRGLRGLNRRSR